MIQAERSSVTGLPRVTEERGAGIPYHALPRQFWRFAVDPQTKQQQWVGSWMSWQGHMLTQVRCWKCGTEIKAWRLALDHYRNPIQIAGQPAVTFTVLDHFRQTPMQVQLPALDQVVTFSVLHCADCVIASVHAMEAVTCYLQGLDAQLQQAWRYRQGTQLTRHDWASHLLAWQNAEPIGRAEETMTLTLQDINKQLLKAKRENKGAITLPTPGEMVTAAHYVHDVLGWSLTGAQPGMSVKYPGTGTIPGWIRQEGQVLDPAQYPRLAALFPNGLPNEPDSIVKV